MHGGQLRTPWLSETPGVWDSVKTLACGEAGVVTWKYTVGFDGITQYNPGVRLFYKGEG